MISSGVRGNSRKERVALCETPMRSMVWSHPFSEQAKRHMELHWPLPN